MRGSVIVSLMLSITPCSPDQTGASSKPEDARFGTVRPRVQIPGPRPFSYSKSTISNVVWSQLHTAVSQFPEEQRNRVGVTASVAGNVRSRDWESLGRSVLSRRTHGAGPSGNPGTRSG